MNYTSEETGMQTSKPDRIAISRMMWTGKNVQRGTAVGHGGGGGKLQLRCKCSNDIGG